MSEREQNTRVKYTHEHVFIYQFQIENHPTYPGTRWTNVEYALCTNHHDPNGKENRKLLESMLRLVYGHYPKGVKFLKEKV